LDGGFHAGGEGRLHAPAGGGTLFDFGLVLGHAQAEGRQIKDLAALVVEHRLVAQVPPAALATRTAVESMDNGLVGLFDWLQGLAGMARLPAAFAAGGAAEAPRGWFGQAVAGGWFAAVAAMERLTVQQMADLPLQVLDLLFRGQESIHHRLGLAAGLAQESLPTGQGAHKAWRKSGRSG
jgi:hypothetical protein